MLVWAGQFETLGINIIFTLANIGYGSNSVARLQESLLSFFAYVQQQLVFFGPQRKQSLIN